MASREIFIGTSSVDLTFGEATVLGMIERAAKNNQDCPGNALLAAAVGAESMATGARLVASLESKGLISVKRWRSARIATVTATGAQTRAPNIKAPPIEYGARRTSRPAKDRPAAKDIDVQVVKMVVAEEDEDLADQIEIEAIRSGIPLSRLYARLIWLGYHCHLDDVAA